MRKATIRPMLLMGVAALAMVTAAAGCGDKATDKEEVLKHMGGPPPGKAPGGAAGGARTGGGSPPGPGAGAQSGGTSR